MSPIVGAFVAGELRVGALKKLGRLAAASFARCINTQLSVSVNPLVDKCTLPAYEPSPREPVSIVRGKGHELLHDPWNNKVLIAERGVNIG